MDLASWLALIGTTATVAAVAVAGYQVHRYRQEVLDQRAAELEAVAVSTSVRIRPTHDDAGNGQSVWGYEFFVDNPGSMPITSVQVLVHFSIPVRRRHFDGRVDEATDVLDMSVPVVAARSASRPWHRTVLVEHALRRELRSTWAEVEFVTPDAGRIRTVWPPHDTPLTIRSALARRLRRVRVDG